MHAEAGWVDPQDGHVGGVVLPDDSRGASRAVGEGDLHGRGAVDHVLLRDDVTAAVDDEP